MTVTVKRTGRRKKPFVVVIPLSYAIFMAPEQFKKLRFSKLSDAEDFARKLREIINKDGEGVQEQPSE